MNTKLSLLFICTLFSYACTQQNAVKDENNTVDDHQHAHSHPHSHSAIDSLFSAVMKVHDEIMPMMDDVFAMKKNLEKTLKEQPKNKTEIENAITSLQASDDAMMNWMHSFDTEKMKGDSVEVIKYLENQLIEVHKMKKTFMQGYEKGKSLTKN